MPNPDFLPSVIPSRPRPPCLFYFAASPLRTRTRVPSDAVSMSPGLGLSPIVPTGRKKSMRRRSGDLEEDRAERERERERSLQSGGGSLFEAKSGAGEESFSMMREPDMSPIMAVGEGSGGETIFFFSYFLQIR